MLNAGPRPQVVVALFAERDDAERAIRELQDAGFPRTGIGVATRERDGEGELIHGTGTLAAEGATTGAVSGGVLGGLVGLLVGVGALVIPGVGPVIAGGMLASALGVAGATAAAGAGIGAATDVVFGALVGLGVPAEEAEHFERGFRAGGTLLSVDPGSRAADAGEILEARHGDLGVAATGVAAGADAQSPAWAGSERRSPVRVHHHSDYESGRAR